MGLGVVCLIFAPPGASTSGTDDRVEAQERLLRWVKGLEGDTWRETRSGEKAIFKAQTEQSICRVKWKFLPAKCFKWFGMKRGPPKKQMMQPQPNCRFYYYPGPQRLFKNGKLVRWKIHQRHLSKYKSLERTALLLNRLRSRSSSRGGGTSTLTQRTQVEVRPRYLRELRPGLLCVIHFQNPFFCSSNAETEFQDNVCSNHNKNGREDPRASGPSGTPGSWDRSLAMQS